MATNLLSGRKCSRCLRWFYHLVDLAMLAFTILLLYWYSQTLSTVIDQLDPPEVIAVTEDYVDVRWHNIRRLDCPTEGMPIFFTPLATEQLPSRPVASGLDEQTFIRRYFFPAHLMKLHQTHMQQSDVKHLAELRIQVTARCNPLWPTTQVVRVPFRMPSHNPDAP